MIESVSFWEEFKAEADIVISHENTGGVLSIALDPLKKYFKDEKRGSLLAYSLARFCGANVRTAFFLEWAWIMYELPKDYTHLFNINRTFLQQNLSQELLDLPVVSEEIEEDAATTLITEQMRFIYQNFVRLRREIITKNPELEQFLTNENFDKISTHQILFKRPEYSQNLNQEPSAKFLENLKYSSSLVSVGFAPFVGFMQHMHHSQQLVDPKKIDWNGLLEICKNIVIVNELKKNKFAFTFAKSQTLLPDQKRAWYNLNLQDRMDVAQKDENVQKKIEDLAKKIKEKTIEDVVKMAFPMKQKETLIRLLSWCFDPEEEYNMGDFF